MIDLCESPPHAQEVSPVPASGHSGFGIASFVISLVSFAAVATGIVTAGLLVAFRRDPNIDKLLYELVGLCVIFFLLLALAGIVLGVLGVLQKKHKKVFAVLGLSINLVTIAGTLLLVLAGHSIR